MTLLYLDLDGASALRGVERRIFFLCRTMKWKVEAVRYDRTARGWHVVIAIKQRIAAPFMVAAQAVLGSDWRREAFNLSRVRQLRSKSPYWRARWNVLYHSHDRGFII